MKISRRSALGILATTATASAIEPPEPQPAVGGPVTLNWLPDSHPTLETGVSWGVPWPRGSVSRTQTFALSANDGKALPLQAWPLAYWPDGSIKYTGFATVTGAPRLLDALPPVTLLTDPTLMEPFPIVVLPV